MTAGTIFILSLLNIMFLMVYLCRQDKLTNKIIWVVTFIILVIFFNMIMGALHSFAGDFGVYLYRMQQLSFFSFKQVLSINFSKSNWTLAFTLLFWMIGQISTDPVYFYIIFLTIALTIFLKIFFKEFKASDRPALMFIYVLYPFFFGYVFLGIRQGLGMIFMLGGILAWNRDEKKKAFLWLTSSLLWHYGMGMAYFFLAPFLLFKNKTTVYYIAIVVFSLSLCFYFSGIDFSTIVGRFVHGNAYAIYVGKANEELVSKLDYKTGIRLSFFLFSMIPVAVFHILKNRIKIQYIRECRYFLSVYMLLTLPYFLMSMMAYSNRALAFSWFIMPVVLYKFCLATESNKIKKYFVLFAAFSNIVLTIYFSHLI